MLRRTINPLFSIFSFAMVTATAVSTFGLAGLAPAYAENRVALVIGNSAYRTVSALPNPANDAKTVTEFLSSAGFEVVARADLTQSEMRQAISEFTSKIAAKGADTVALVYYAGHGLQVDGENFLLPIDARIEREADVPFQALRLADVMNALASVPSRMRIVMLDACRNNPFSAINKTTGRGLAIVDAPAGSIVAYSTAPGSEAEDGSGSNSPFTAAFTSVAKDPCLPIELALKQVRVTVNERTGGRQTPWDSSSLTSDFFFFSGCARPKEKLASDDRRGKPAEFWRTQMQGRPVDAAYAIAIGADVPEAYQEFVALYPAAPFGPRVRSLLDRRQEMIAWYAAVSIGSVASFQAFLARYGNSDLAPTARRLLDRARQKPQIAAATPAQEIGARATPASATGGMCPCPPAPGRTGLPATPGAPTPPRDAGIGVVPAAPAITTPPFLVAPPPVVRHPPVVVSPPPAVRHAPAVVSPPPAVRHAPAVVSRPPAVRHTPAVVSPAARSRVKPAAIKTTTRGAHVRKAAIAPVSRRAVAPRAPAVRAHTTVVRRVAAPRAPMVRAVAPRPVFRAPVARGGFGYRRR